MKKWKILTVGDGDLTLSLSLARAYGDSYVQVTASVLDSKNELLSSFPDAPLSELERLQVPVLFGIDATQLHRQYPPNSWDIVLFHHPHLGLASLENDEAKHATLHHQLICHYLYSAMRVAKLVHVCLCGTQRKTWNLDAAAQRQGLQLTKELSTAAPFSNVWTEKQLEPAATCSEHAAPRRYRNGKLGSRHFLGKFGYRHRRTAGERYNGGSLDMNVAGSTHFVFSETCETVVDPGSDLSTVKVDNCKTADATCSICGTHFASKTELSKHMKAPALPQVAELSNMSSACASTVQRNAHSVSEENSKQQLQPPGNRDLPSNPQTEETVVEKVYELKVDSVHNDKRLRWFLQHNTNISKRLAESAIQSGRVLIDGTVASDSSRILKSGMVVVMFSSKGENSSLATPNARASDSVTAITVRHRQGPILVVDKPPGMRTKGAFQGTLEFAMARQEGHRYESLSKLDASCSGLCVLMSHNALAAHSDSAPKIQHFLLALVHGRVPDDWLRSHQLSVDVQPKWKQKKRKHGAGENDMEETSQLDSSTTIQIVPLERTTTTSGATSSSSSSSTSLSTVCIQTEHPSAASVCQWMRREGYPVVGDMNCRREYLQLKRSIRNRIKNKLCLICYRVEWYDTSQASWIQIPAEKSPPIPEKLSAKYWETHFGDASVEASQPQSADSYNSRHHDSILPS